MTSSTTAQKLPHQSTSNQAEMNKRQGNFYEQFQVTMSWSTLAQPQLNSTQFELWLR